MVVHFQISNNYNHYEDFVLFFSLSVLDIELFRNMSNFMKKPNIIVHLDVPPKEGMRRIAKRNRECEKGITLEYITALHKAYEEFIAEVCAKHQVVFVNFISFDLIFPFALPSIPLPL